MKLLIVFALLGAILAQYGQGPPSYPSAPAPLPYPPRFPWPGHHHGHHHHHRDSSSDSRRRSRSNSKEKKCANCRKLKKFRDSTKNLVDPRIEYIHGKKDCLRAIVRCPFDNGNYTLYAGNDENDNEALSTGFFIERTIKCNKRGKWEVEAQSGDKYSKFKYVSCQDNGVTVEQTPVGLF